MKSITGFKATNVALAACENYGWVFSDEKYFPSLIPQDVIKICAMPGFKGNDLMTDFNVLFAPPRPFTYGPLFDSIDQYFTCGSGSYRRGNEPKILMRIPNGHTVMKGQYIRENGESISGESLQHTLDSGSPIYGNFIMGHRKAYRNIIHREIIVTSIRV